MIKEPIIPVIHLNGTSSKDLIEELSTAYDRLNLAYDALKRTGPNGRDYYIKPGTMELAVEQHIARLSAVQGVMDNIVAVITGITDQEEYRRSSR